MAAGSAYSATRIIVIAAHAAGCGRGGPSGPRRHEAPMMGTNALALLSRYLAYLGRPAKMLAETQTDRGETAQWVESC
jgi:hypothetical protein